MRYDGPGYPPPWPPGPEADRSRGGGAGLTVAAVLIGIWTVAVTVGLQTGGWLVGDFAVIADQSVPGLTWPVLALFNLILVAGPAGLLWGLTARLRPGQVAVWATGRAWTLAGVTGGLLAALRGIPQPQNEILLLVTALVAVAAGFLPRLVRGAPRIVDATRPDATTPSAGSVTLFAVAAGLAVLLPWLWVGALGGAAETVLAVAAAAGFGWLASGVVGSTLFGAFARSRARLILLGGLVAGVALVPLAAGLGGRGVNLAELLTVPALGFAAAALGGASQTSATRPRSHVRGLPVAVLIGLAAVGPVAFLDPEEVSLVLGLADVLRWTLIATLISIAVAWFVGGTYGLLLRPRRRLIGSRLVPLVTALVVLAAAGVVYGVAGRPGLFGERLFVVMADQADLSGLASIADRPTRLRATYQRLVEHGRDSQADLRRTLDKWGLHYTPYYLVNAILVDGGPIVRQWLAGRSDVDRVLLDQRLRPLPVSPPTEHGDAPTPTGDPQWNIAAIQAPRVWSEFADQGQGIVIGTSDSGVDAEHPDLKGSFRGGDDSWFDPWNGTRTPTAHNGHGTHTIGTALGRNGIGVAPQAQWIGCVNLDRDLGSPSRYLDCLQFMLAPFPIGGDPWRDGRPERAPDILTNSWGCPSVEGCDLTALLPATAAFRAAGVYFVAAAGNSGPSCSSVDDPPSPYPDVLTVGAVNQAGQVVSFSSRGPTSAFPPTPTDDGRTKPDVVAPGADVLSALPGGTYGVLDGTSMATPHVAGVVALMWSANPALVGDIDTTTRILRDTATPVSAAGSVCDGVENVTGTGQVDAYAAVVAARAVTPGADR